MHVGLTNVVIIFNFPLKCCQFYGDYVNYYDKIMRVI